MTLETIVDNLRNGYNLLQPGTMLHADQLTTERRTEAELRGQCFYTADGPLYSVESGVPTLFLTRESDNLVLRHLSDAVNSSYDQLVDRNNGNYHPGAEEAQTAMHAKDTLRIDLTKLRLNGDDVEWRYLEIGTANYDQLNPEERKLAERYFGLNNDFVQNMDVLQRAGISNTKVYVLNPAYVQREAQNGPVGRASWLANFNIGSLAYASSRAIFIRGALRGVRRVVAPQLSERGEESHERFPKGKSRVKRLESASGVTRGRAPEKEEVLVASAAVPEMKGSTIKDILQFSRDYVAPKVWADYEAGVRHRLTLK